MISSPLFTMYLKKYPTYYIKGDQCERVYHTVRARELEAEGWVVEGQAVAVEAPSPVVAEPVAEVVTEPAAEEAPDFLEMTKAELVAYAEANEIVVRSNATKSEVLQACLESESNDG